MIQDFQQGWRRQMAPVTMGFAASLVLAWIYWLFAVPADRTGSIPLTFTGEWRQPWTALTYPWVLPPGSAQGSLISVLFVSMGFVWFGGPIERDLDTRSYLGFLLGAILVPAMSFTIATALTGLDFALYGAWLTLAIVTVAWCSRYPTAEMRLFFFIPISARIMRWIIAVGLLVMYAPSSPIFGLAAGGSLAFGWAFGEGKLPWGYQDGRRRRLAEVHATRAQARYDEGYYEDVRRREQERAEQERLRKLLEGPYHGDSDR